MPKEEDYEEVVEAGDITLYKHKESGKLHLRASDPYYAGDFTKESAEKFLQAILESPHLDLVEFQKNWLVRYMFPDSRLTLPENKE